MYGLKDVFSQSISAAEKRWRVINEPRMMSAEDVERYSDDRHLR